MTIEIRELIIEAKVIESEKNPSQIDDETLSIKIADETKLVDLISRRVLEILREDIKRLK